MYHWAVATQRPADSQTAPSAAATGPVRVKAWSKNPAVLHSVTGDPQRSSPLAVLAPAQHQPVPPAALQRCCPSPAGSSGHTEPGTRCAPTIARCNCEMHARCPWANLARNSDGSLTRRLSNVGTSDSPPVFAPQLLLFPLSFFSYLLGLDFFQPDRPVAVASSRIASLPAERGQAAQAQTGPLPSSPPSLRLSVIPAEPLAARMPRCCAPSTSACDPRARSSQRRVASRLLCSWSAHHSTPNPMVGAAKRMGNGSPLGTDPPPSPLLSLPLSFVRPPAQTRRYILSLEPGPIDHTPPLSERRTDPARLRFRAGIHWPPCHRRRRSIDSAALSHDQTPSCVLHESQTPIGLRPL
ncbi:hypothetical protein Trihar35433_8976 [Trichoderma harzianum]|nr:hypothetical protein Trihar35433_8976 [Trichoderma harzianum]